MNDKRSLLSLLFRTLSYLGVLLIFAVRIYAEEEPNSGHTGIMDGALAVPFSLETTVLPCRTSEGVVAATAMKGRAVVQCRPGTPEPAAEAIIRKHGGKVIAKIPRLGFYLAEASPGSELKFIDTISREPAVQRAEPDFLLNKPGYTGAPVEGVAGYLDEIRAPEAWKYLQDKQPHRKVGIGIIDGGFYGLREGKADFGGRLKGIPAEGGKESHGTIAAVIAAASGNNDPNGNVGVNWTSDVYPGVGLYSSHLAWSFSKMVKDGVEVINISLGGGQSALTGNGKCDAGEAPMQIRFIRELVSLINAANSFLSPGTGSFLVIVAAGNDDCELGDNLGDTGKPENLLIVGGFRGDAAATGSNKGGLIDIAAPYDVQRLYSYIDKTYSDYGGTSYAAPQVAGAAALAWAFDRKLKTAGQVAGRLRKTARDSMPEFGGAGVLNVHAVLTGMKAQDGAKPKKEKGRKIREEAPKREWVF